MPVHHKKIHNAITFKAENIKQKHLESETNIHNYMKKYLIISYLDAKIGSGADGS